MRYELWHSASEGCHTFFPANQRPHDLPADAQQVWSVEAADWEDAQRMKHRHLGWEAYEPLDAAEDD